MNDERRGEGGGAVAAVVIVIVLAFIGLLAIGGVGTMFVMRSSQMARMAEMEARVMAEQARAEAMAMEARARAAASEAEAALNAATTERKSAETPGPELLLEISAAGEYKLGEKTLSFEELKDVLLAEQVEKGANLALVIAPQPETPFKRVRQALEAAKCASIVKTTFHEPDPQP